MKKTSIVLLALICIGLISSFVNFSKTITYYEWVQNGSFENYINYFEDSGAESNAFNSGVQYGNFSTTGTATIIPDGLYDYSSHSGNYMFMTGDINQSFSYTLLNPIIGADIINASVYYSEKNSVNPTLTITYTDETNNVFTNFGDSASWTYVSFLNSINDAKYVASFTFYYSSDSGTYLLDDFVLYDVDEDTQYYISYNTKPWYEPQIWSVDIYQSITSGQKHSGNWSYHDWILSGDEGYVYQGGVPITQSFIGLDSDLINDFRLYAKTDNEIEIEVYFMYSDETYSVDSKIINASTWTLYVFDVAVPNKILVGFRIIPFSTGQQFINMNIDDVSLTATVPFNPTVVNDSDQDGIPDNFDTDGEEEEDEEDDANLLNRMQTSFITGFPILLIFALFCIPAIVYLGIAGLIAGVNISSIVCVWMEIGQPYFIALMVLFDLTIIFWKVDVSHSVSEQRIVKREGTRPLRKPLKEED